MNQDSLQLQLHILWYSPVPFRWYSSSVDQKAFIFSRILVYELIMMCLVGLYSLPFLHVVDTYVAEGAKESD